MSVYNKLCVLCVRRNDKDHLFIMGLGKSVYLGAEMAALVSPCPQSPGAEWTGDGGCCSGRGGAALSLLPALLSCSNPVRFPFYTLTDLEST